MNLWVVLVVALFFVASQGAVIVRVPYEGEYLGESLEGSQSNEENDVKDEERKARVLLSPLSSSLLSSALGGNGLLGYPGLLGSGLLGGGRPGILGYGGSGPFGTGGSGIIGTGGSGLIGTGGGSLLGGWDGNAGLYQNSYVYPTIGSSNLLPIQLSLANLFGGLLLGI